MNTVTLLQWVYVITFFITLLESVLYIEMNRGKVSKNQLLLFIFSTIACLSYTMLVFTETAKECYICYLFYFIGIAFSVLSMLFVISDLCGIKIPRLLQKIGFIFAFVCVVLLCITDSTKLWFKSYSLDHFYSLSIIETEFGKLHFLYYIFIGICVLTAIGLAIYSIIKSKRVSKFALFSFICILIIMITSYLIPKFTSLKVELMNFAYTLSLGILLPILKRANMSDMSASLLNVFERREDYGYITFDLKKRFMGCSKYAEKLFPSLKNVAVDSFVPTTDALIYEKLFPFIDNWDGINRSEQVIENDDIAAICSIQYLKQNKHNIGYFIELKDNTVQQNYLNFMKSYNNELSHTVENQTEKLLLMQESIITGMSSMVESRDNSTGGHILRTSDCIKIFIKKIQESNKYSNLSPMLIENIIKAAPMHDLGKIAVKDEILRKPGKFTPEEYEEMKKHSTEGAKIVAKVLENIDDTLFITIAVNMAHYHHERWDGSGYPNNLKEKEIPFEARVMAIADVFDALVSRRCYKDAFSYDDAFNIITNSLGTHFDPELGKIFIMCRQDLEELYNNYFNKTFYK